MWFSFVVGLLQGTTVPDTLTLDRALEIAERSRGRIVEARAGVDRARADARRGTAIPNPGVKFEHGAEAPTNALEVTQPLSWLVTNGAQRAAGNAAIRSARADSIRTRFELDAEVIGAYYRTLAADETARLVRQQALAADTLLQLTTRRVSLGDLSDLERDQVAQEAATLHLHEARAAEEAFAARLALQRAIGAQLPPTTVVAGRFALEGTDPAPASRVPLTVGTVSTPRVTAALEDSAAAVARYRVAQMRQLPIPAFLGKREWGGPPNATSTTIVGFSLPLPLWQFGQHDVALARAEAAAQAAATQEARLDAVQQIEEARMRMQLARTRAAEASQTLFPTAQRLRAGAVRLFDAGRTGILPVFEAFRREREAALLMIEELLAMHTAAATLRALTGTVQ
jgi:outer membrane protein, heavy metal efflux system